MIVYTDNMSLQSSDIKSCNLAHHGSGLHIIVQKMDARFSRVLKLIFTGLLTAFSTSSSFFFFSFRKLEGLVLLVRVSCSTRHILSKIIVFTLSEIQQLSLLFRYCLDNSISFIGNYWQLPLKLEQDCSTCWANWRFSGQKQFC